MATSDRSRSDFHPGRNYRGARMQQGRVLTDDDFNVDAFLTEWERAADRQAIIGPHGTSDSGFRVFAPSLAGGVADFSIAPGAYYLKGLRAALQVPTTFRLQPDWLQRTDIDAPPGPRRDMVLLEAWRQEVGATEDATLFEAALGGPDTTTRIKTMARIRLVTDVVGDCEDAFDAVIDRLTDAGLTDGTGGNLLTTTATLTLAFTNAGQAQDLCSPSALGGYLGAENRTVRIQITTPDSFVWGYENGGPLYRARILANDRLELLTDPRDEEHWPVAGQTVQILPWGAVLPGGEKVADEVGPTHFSTLATGYDPDEREITLSAALPGDFGDAWRDRSDAATLEITPSEPGDPFVWVRVWDRGADLASPAELPTAGATPLGDTGVEASFQGGPLRPGDFWIVALRPETPDEVVPGRLLSGAPPEGYARAVACLALIDWNPATGVHPVIDCRRRFRPLTRLGGCCRFTVGDDHESFGDYDTVQAAVDALPSTGGEICVLPGRHVGRIRLDRRANVTISGCGPRSRLIAPDDGSTEPLIEILGGQSNVLRSLALDAPEAVGILGRGVIDDGRLRDRITGLRLERLHIEVRDAGAIDVRQARDLHLTDSRITLAELERDLEPGDARGRAPAVFLAGADLIVERNRILGFDLPSARRPAGGLQIGGGSTGVMVRDNDIIGGNGPGIALGNILMIKVSQVDLFLENWFAALAISTDYFPGAFVYIDANGCIRVVPPGSNGGDGDDPLPPDIVPVSGGDLRHIEIRDNRIGRMEQSGITSPLAFRDRRPEVIGIADLLISGNTIRDCATLETPELARDLRLFAAYGGIALHALETSAITDNQIESNGRSHLEPICGIAMLSAETVVIADNRIVDNGPRIETDATPKPGLRGGIVAPNVAPHPTSKAGDPSIRAYAGMASAVAAARAVALPALMVEGNLVYQPIGKALNVFGFGRILVSGNHLSSQGTPTRSFEEALAELLKSWGSTTPAAALVEFLDRVAGTAATVISLGFSSELGDFALLTRLLRVLSAGTGAAGPVEGGQGGSAAVEVPRLRLEKLPDQPSGDTLPSRGSAGAMRFLRTGEIQFHGNAVIQDFMDAERSFTLCAVLLASFDDVSAADNSITSQVDYIGDFSVTSLLAFGWSLRVSDNRFEETLLRSLYSAVTIGMMNATTGNQGTHCFQVQGPDALTIDDANRSLITLVNPLACAGCLRPPFAGLDFSVKGDTVEPQLDTVLGIEGVVVGDELDIDLGTAVSDLDLGFVLNDASMSVAAIREDGTNEARTINGGGEVDVLFAGSGWRRIRMIRGNERIVLHRICVGSVDGAVGGVDLGFPSVMAFD